jgi:threonine dehydratase
MQNTVEVRECVEQAERTIRPYVRETPLDISPALGALTGGEVRLKLECAQLTGSFKLRGALNKYLSLSPEQKERGVLTASSGNHGAAVAYVLERFGGKGVIYLPETVAPAKLAAIRAHGAQVVLHGKDGVEAEHLARRTGEETGQVYISPYNDPLVVGGQGTIAIELLRQMESVDALLVPVGGGGLVGGIAGYLKAMRPGIEIIGCQPEHSRVMYESVQAGDIVERPSLPTLADGTAGGVEPGAVTFPLCRDLVDEWILVSEEEIARAIALMLEEHYLLVEGAAALPVAALSQRKERFAGRAVALVLSGKRISTAVLREVLESRAVGDAR